MHDGVNINSAEKIKRLVLPGEVKNLPPLTCYVKLCGEYPITKLTVKLQAQSKLSITGCKLFNHCFKTKKEFPVIETKVAVNTSYQYNSDIELDINLTTPTVIDTKELFLKDLER